MEPGTVIAEKFRIERVLGKGGMGTVVIATHLQLDQKVALKFLNPELAHQPAIAERFLREARSSAKLRSDYACRVMDVSQLPTGEPYIVMELLDGEDLGRLVAKHPLAIGAAADFVIQACVAVAEAHAAGIVHRDLKPANLFLTRRMDGSALVKVLDFGIATAPGGESRITQTASIMGSPAYMSPEQLRSARDVDARSDIWSLGVILYELVSGRLPFPGESITEIAVKVSIDPPIPLDVDPAFDAVVFRAIDKDLAKRYQTVAELAQALVPFASPQAATLAGVIARLIAGAIDPVASTALAIAPTQASRPPMPTTLAGSATALPVAPAKRTGLALALVGLVAIGGIAAVVIATRDDQRPEPVRTVVASVPVPIPIPIDAARIDATAVAVAPIDAAVAKPPPPRPTVPPPPPDEPTDAHRFTLDQVTTKMTAANKALDAGHAIDAVAAADEVLRDRPQNVFALVVATIGQCQLEHPQIAKRHWMRLGKRQREHGNVLDRCRALGVEL